MQIFLDESGTFVPAKDSSPSVSLVGALVVPSHSAERLYSKYSKLRLSLPKDKKGEVKGSKLNERDVAKVCDLLRKNDCIYEAAGIDMGIESGAQISEHQVIQAQKITEHLTDEFTETLREELWEQRRILEAMAPQLYVQTCVATSVLSTLLTMLPTYFAQRWPKDLGQFDWIIDGKGAEKTTSAEDWWSLAVAPLLQSQSVKKPIIQLEGADFSTFHERYETATPDHLREHGFTEDEGISLNRLIRESFRFSSLSEPGLELVDIVTNALRRGLHNRLGKSGWLQIPRLMIHRREHYLSLLTLSQNERNFSRRPYAAMIGRDLSRGGRPMLTAATLASEG